MVGSTDPGPIFDAARSSAISKFTKAKQDELLQTYRKTVCRPSPMSTMPRCRSARPRELRAAARGGGGLKRAFQLSEQQLRAGTGRHRNCVNTQLALFQAEDLLSQAQLARLLADRQPVSSAGGRLGAEDGEPVDAL